MNMKLVALFLVLMMVSSCQAAMPRRALIGGVYGQVQRQHVSKGKAIEGYKNSHVDEYQERSINNHHNIPRQQYGDRSSNTQEGTDENGDDGNG
ncbi:hypothetical protein HS088_TW05G00607 [Tripterygium wilfordii]|uniref:Uncharacterized protein n=1 Tax=Tripterygium wilfordii TaxID=458696 RepID=A0A7J7DNJ4_TRIWF|nr:hypothetical protein HS088_TW05G00607 [Tripterygium wilfordii]